MALCTIRLTGREEIASGTMAFHFAKPDGFAYEAGQFCDPTLDDPPETDAEWGTSAASRSPAPPTNTISW